MSYLTFIIGILSLTASMILFKIIIFCLTGEQLVKERHLKKALPVLEECVQISSKCLYKHNSDLRTYKDCLARVYAEMGKFVKMYVKKLL